MSKEDWFNPYDGIDFVDIDTTMIIGKKNNPRPSKRNIF